MLKRIALGLGLMCSPLAADVAQVIEGDIPQRYAHLETTTKNLAEVVANDCTPSAIKPAFHSAYDAWISVSHISFGPVEDLGLSLAMSFWPDPKNRTARALTRLIEAQDSAVDDPAAFSDVSVAAQGFSALERLLYDPQDDADYACKLVRAITVGLAQKSQTLNEAWPAFADLMLTAGVSDNERFQSKDEARRTLYTALTTGLEFLKDQRLGRPLGTFDRPRPKRAEARRSDRSLRHIELSLRSLKAMAVNLFDSDLTKTKAAFADALSRVDDLGDPDLSGVSDPARRIRVEALQAVVGHIQEAVRDEIGVPLGIKAGFNALDGD